MIKPNHKKYHFILAAILFSCNAELIKPIPAPEIEIISPVTFKGIKGELRDSFRGPRGAAYELTVRFISNGHPQATNPTISFDGSGSGSPLSSISKDNELKLWYRPATEGIHPILLYWKNQDCGFYPNDVIRIQLNVDFIEQ